MAGRFYGRRQGRPLRKEALRLMENLLPELRLADEQDVSRAFDNDHPLWLEIGFGGGEHLAVQAKQNPDVTIIGVDPFVNGVASLLKQLAANGARNVRIHQADVRPFLPVIPDGAFARIFVLFPDPWHKSRHNKRRLLQGDTLNHFARLLKPGGQLRLATDDAGYLRWILERMMSHPAFDWQADGPAHWRQRPADWPPTRYEQKGRENGRVPAYLQFLRRTSPVGRE